ncbi:CoA-acylating methylmalonate-semialdehyde dehydrogenase [Aeromicrobium sp. CTD01-1L150]|uniref:CoA-acylating methylmalonate-semialdehyde dehydrogenase n=1 Tax=Aeromicrobium sp. CTD01-1L150 TaxID=3341830 RepID=UPI0035BFEDBB
MTTTESTPPATQLSHWPADSAQLAASSRHAEVLDPATGEIVALVPMATAEDVDSIVGAASAAFKRWRSTSIARRTAVLFRFRELLADRAEELAVIISREHGKTLPDARAEIARGREVVELACGAGQLLQGPANANASSGVDVVTTRHPVGVAAVISPFNFPAMVPMWFHPVAIAAGNSVVLKPSEQVPGAANWVAELWQEAGLPDGVFSVVHGDREAVDALLVHPEVASVSFVGSTPVARHVYETASAHGKRVQALGGAKNHMVVLPDADLDHAADQAINAGFGSAGQRCMAVSVVVAVGSIADDLVERIARRARDLRVGPAATDPDLGPVISDTARVRVTRLVSEAESEGASVVVDGRSPKSGFNGFFVGPTLLDHVGPAMTVYREEVFGPVLAVVRVADLAAALDLINSGPYGNGVAIFTRDGGAAREFQAAVEVGMVGINVPVPVPVAYHSFGGWKSSLFGDTHAHGAEGFHFFTRAKAVTSRWPEAEPTGLDLDFPQNS